MKMLKTRKFWIACTIASLTVAVSAVAYADTALKKITAYQNEDISITVDGRTVDLSSAEGTMYPIVYDGHSYVSAKALAEALGATVKWDGNTQTVKVTSKGGTSNTGIPDKDNTSTTTTPSTPAPTSSASFTKELSADFNVDSAASDMKPAALAFFKAFAYAVKTGDTSRVDGIARNSVVEKTDDNWFVGIQFTLDELHENIDILRKQNKADVLTRWAEKIEAMTLSDVKIDYTNKLSSIASIKYKVQPDGFDAFSSLVLYLDYSVPYDSTTYQLENLYVL